MLCISVNEKGLDDSDEAKIGFEMKLANLESGRVKAKKIVISLIDSTCVTHGGIIILCYKKSIYINSIWISKKIRRCGYGTILLNFIDELAAENNFSHICLDTFDNFLANSFYQPCGYQIVSIIEKFQDDHSRISMKKIISNKV